MFVAPSVTALTSALVHQSVATQPAERTRHETFITHKLAVSFAALASGPFYLAYHGAPALLDSLIFSFALVPLIAAMIVARTGQIVVGHATMFVGLVAFGLLLSFATQIGIAGGFAWFMLAQAEATLAGSPKLTRASTLGLSIVLIGLLSIGNLTGNILPGSASAFLISGGLTLAYAITSASTFVLSFAEQKSPQADLDPLLKLHEQRGDLVIRFSNGALVDRVNGQIERVLGQDAADVLGRGLFQLVHVADRPAFLTLIADAAQGNEFKIATLRLRIADGSRDAGFASPRFMWAEISALRVAGSSGSISEVIAILRDVSDLREAQDARSRQDNTETPVRSKDDFLANMSHELRTPLNAIIGFSEMLGSHTLRPSDPDKQREYARIINQSGQHLLSVVNAILDMSKLQSGTFGIIPEPFELAPLVDQCCDIVRLKAQEGRIKLHRDCPEGLEQITGDKRAIKQILINLLSNAMKFTQENGEVYLAVKPQGNAILVTVSDTGIGIEPDDLTRLGSPFFQARSSLNRPFEGTGLGLSIVRGLVGLHGGTMSIESEPGKGTSVIVRLPLNCQAIASRTAPATIETISRPPTVSARPQSFEPRMKSIA